MRLKEILKRNIRRHSLQKRTAILFTGGLDSSALALLSLPGRNTLIFAAVDARECLAYNTASIAICSKIAAHLDLPFRIITISKRDYLLQVHFTAKLMSTPIADKDLPAVSFLFKKLKHLKISSAVSGMGSDEVFKLPKKQLKSFLQHPAKETVSIHQRIARAYGISFHCPYLSPAITRHCLATPLRQRSQKQDLIDILKEDPTLYTLLKDRPAAHSSIPESFWMPLSALPVFKKNLPQKPSFQDMMMTLWAQTHGKKLTVRPMRSF